MGRFLIALFFFLIPQAAFAGTAIYSTPGSYTFTVPNGVTSIKVFVIGGGGGGGGGAADWGGGGGGGCGGAVAGNSYTVSSGQQYSVTVGSGGGGGGNAANGAYGSASQFGSLTAAGGGYGGRGYYGYPNSYGSPGGSGGGSGGGGGGNPYPGFYAASFAGGSGGSQPPSSGYGGYYPATGYCSGGAWSVSPGTYITKTSYSIGSGGWGYNSLAYCGGGGGGGIVIGGSTTNGQSGYAPTSGTWGPSCNANGGQGYGAGGGGSYYGGGSGGAGAPGAVYVEWTDPATCSVSLTPGAINQGGGSTLSWSATNANTSVYINNVGYVSGSSGSFSVYPSSTTNYSCYAQGSGGSDGWHNATLTVNRSCSLPWGGTIAHGQSTTAYQNATVPYNQSCVSQTRTCNDGTLSGSYAYASCSQDEADACVLGGVTVEHGDSYTFYTTQTAPTGQTCTGSGGGTNYSQVRTCTDGVLSGSSTYQYSSCSCAATYSCSGNTVTYTNAACSTTSVVACVSPQYCSPGISSCVSPEPVFEGFGAGFSGHLEAKPLLVPRGLTARLYWNVSNVDSCTVTGDNGDSWTGLTSGSSGKLTLPLTARTVFTLSCEAYEGATFDDESVTVNLVPIFNEN